MEINSVMHVVNLWAHEIMCVGMINLPFNT